MIASLSRHSTQTALRDAPTFSHAPDRTLCRLFLILAICSCLVANAATIAYSTYFGAYAVVVDGAGNAFVAGATSSTNVFPALNPLQPDYGGGFTDGFVAKFDPDGRLLFSTYFGGAGPDAVNAVALDREGNLIIVGETHSVDLPTTEGAFQSDYAGGSAFGYGDGFIAKLSPDGARLLYCSYFGGSGDEKINGMAIDKEGNVSITGQTDSPNLPVKDAFQSQSGGGENDGFVARFDSTLKNLRFSTYLGGEDKDEDQKIAVDPGGFIYVSGRTLSTNYPVTSGAFQTKHIQIPEDPVNWDAGISKLQPDGSAMVYSTYVGGAAADAAFAIAADADGSAYVAGVIAASWNQGSFPLGFQPTPGFGSGDAFVAKLKPDGSNFAWFSYLGGSDEDVGFGLALDDDNNVFVSGITNSRDFPTADAPQPKLAGGHDSFVAKVSPDGKRLVYSTYLGGSNEEWGYAIAPDSRGNLIAVGQSDSSDFPIHNAVQTTNGSIERVEYPADAYLVKLTPAVEPPPMKIVRSGNNVLMTWATNFTGFVLESTGTLAPTTAQWKPVNAAPLMLSGQFAVIQRSDVASQFFRLRRP